MYFSTELQVVKFWSKMGLGNKTFSFVILEFIKGIFVKCAPMHISRWNLPLLCLLNSLVAIVNPQDRKLINSTSVQCRSVIYLPTKAKSLWRIFKHFCVQTCFSTANSYKTAQTHPHTVYLFFWCPHTSVKSKFLLITNYVCHLILPKKFSR